jgi:hypothetical protein
LQIVQSPVSQAERCSLSHSHCVLPHGLSRGLPWVNCSETKVRRRRMFRDGRKRSEANRGVSYERKRVVLGKTIWRAGVLARNSSMP